MNVVTDMTRSKHMTETTNAGLVDLPHMPYASMMFRYTPGTLGLLSGKRVLSCSLTSAENAIFIISPSKGKTA